MLNADWVQLNCRCRKISVQTCKVDFVDGKTVPGAITTEVIDTNQVQWGAGYTVKKQPIRTSLAAGVYYVYYGSVRLAEVLTDVDSRVVDNMTVFVRFDNKFLYGKNLYERVLKFLDDNNLVFHNWTRLDVSCDFNFMLNGHGQKKLNPHDFIKEFIFGKVKLLNKRRGKKRKGGLWFEAGEEEIDFQTLYLGSPTSAIRTKLYNKTKELADKEDKPYIREQWALNGLSNDSPVWRLEFRIQDFGDVLIQDDTLRMTMKELEILKDDNIEALWNCLREHYFVFYKPNKDKNVTRQKRLKLFDYEDTGIKLVEVTKKENTTRSTKIFVKKLLQTQQQLREYHQELKNVSWATDYVSAWLVERHDLMEWAKEKFPTWQPENYLEPPSVDVPVIQYSIKGFGTPEETMVREKHKYTFEV